MCVLVIPEEAENEWVRAAKEHGWDIKWIVSIVVE